MTISGRSGPRRSIVRRHCRGKPRLQIAQMTDPELEGLKGGRCTATRWLASPRRSASFAVSLKNPPARRDSVLSLAARSSSRLPPRPRINGVARLLPVTTFARFLTAMRLDLLDPLHVNERPDHRTRLESIGDLRRPGGLGEAFSECVIDAVLHQAVVGTDAGLPPKVARHSKLKDGNRSFDDPFIGGGEKQLPAQASFAVALTGQQMAIAH